MEAYNGASDDNKEVIIESFHMVVNAKLKDGRTTQFLTCRYEDFKSREDFEALARKAGKDIAEAIFWNRNVIGMSNPAEQEK